MRGGPNVSLMALLTLIALPAGLDFAQAAIPRPVNTIDDFENAGEWKALVPEGVELALSADDGRNGRAIRLDFHFVAGGGYAVMRKEFDFPLPANYVIEFDYRGEAPVNHLEFKLVDETGENVWWSVMRDVAFSEEWTSARIKKRHVSFAWGPRGGGDLERVAAIEFAVTAGTGGEGTIWIDNLTIQELPPPNANPPDPVATASSSRAGFEAPLAIDGDSSTFWAGGEADTLPRFALDLGGVREYGGLVIDWAPGQSATDYAIEASFDGRSWETLRSVTGANGGRDYHFLPESESSRIRVRCLKSAGTRAGGHDIGRGIAVREITLQPLAWGADRQTFFQGIAGDAPRGTYPRGMTGEAVYWTVAGVDNDPREALMSEDGAIETGKGAFTIEPFLFVDGELITWADVETDQTLHDGWMPIPGVSWYNGLALEVLAMPTGAPGASSLTVSYEVHAADHGSHSGTLFLAVRPFQVNPPYQNLNMAGGTAPVHEITWDGKTIDVDGKSIAVSGTPAGFGAATFDQGDIVADWLRYGKLPETNHVQDPFGAASCALVFPFDLDGLESRIVTLRFPLDEQNDASAPVTQATADTRSTADGLESPVESLREAAEHWRDLPVARIKLPPVAREIEQTLYAQLGYILVNRAGPAIQPGARSYARSWIRDGALTSSALLRMGHREPVRAFIEWFAEFQYDNGKVPCCVDTRGADPVPEHDSGGEFIFLIAEYYRYTRDDAFLIAMWPQVKRAASYLDSLRGLRLTSEFEATPFYGLLPPSISHEGYSAKPMHSYWDDLFALTGFHDAAFLAGALGYEREQERWRSVRGAFEGDLVNSMRAAMTLHDIDYIPGCADLGDFDATSTTIAFHPAQASETLPREALLRTFEKYYEFFTHRKMTGEWDAYTPYELRHVGAFVRLGWRERAHEALDWFMEHRRPAGWKQWGEVVLKDEREARFIGDMPHTWVGSDYIRSVLDMLVTYRESDETLVVGGGILSEWLDAPGITVSDLPTPFGTLSFTLLRKHTGSETLIEAVMSGDLDLPAGGILLDLPGGNRTIHKLPARVTLP